MRNEGSRESSTDAAADGREIGWGISAEDRQEDMFLRRVVFSVLVAVVGCMGAWFVLTTVTGPGPEQRTLIVNGPNGRVPLYTVELLRVEATRDSEAMLKELVEEQSMRELAEGQGFFHRAVGNGQRALCCGRFVDRATAEAVLKRFQEYTESSRRGFPGAAVMSLSD